MAGAKRSPAISIFGQLYFVHDSESRRRYRAMNKF
jgi:hypothetical protein